MRHEPIDTLLWANGPVADDVKQGHLRVWEQPFNCGQHIAHNEMLDECVRLGADYHLRIDDDCFLANKKWKAKLLNSLRIIKEGGWQRVTAGITIHGLNNPPEAESSMIFRAKDGKRGVRVEKVNILGGIFRVTPMPLVRYFRWDERLPMGMGEARQFANFCAGNSIDMVRLTGITATHGESTARQESNNPMWAAEHDMLQYIPFGL